MSELDRQTLRRLIDIGQSLVSRLDLEGVIETVLGEARALTGARYAALGVLDERGIELERFIVLGIDEETHRRIGALPRGHGVLGHLIRHPEPLRLPDLSRHPSSEGFPPGHPPMRSFLGVPIKLGNEHWANLYLTEKVGGEFSAADEQAMVILAGWAAIAVENARMYEGLARHRDEVESQRDRAERSVRALGVMADIARSVGGETQLDRILASIVSRGRSLVECRTLLILLVDGDELVVAATDGTGGEELHGERVPVAGTAVGRVLERGQAERLLGRIESDPGLAKLGIEPEAAMIVPLSFRGSSSGVLVAVDREVDGPEFGDEDERLLRSFAASAATAVATAQTVEAERLRHSLEAAEQERRRWARELHDETLQALGGLRMLHSAALRGESSVEELREAIQESVELIDEEIENLSSLIVELRPAALDQIGLAPALRTLAERRSRDGDLKIDMLVRLSGDDEDGRLPAEIESLIYRFVQEALNNVAKHAQASWAEAVVQRRGEVVEVSVRDDGRGFDPGATGEGGVMSRSGQRGGFGLIGMRERVELAGGELRIESRPGEGTTLRATVPLKPALAAGLAWRSAGVHGPGAAGESRPGADQPSSKP